MEVHSLFALQLVVLDCPIRLWSDRSARDLFCGMMGLKLRGYWAVYPEQVLPLDTTDFITSHLLVCEKTPQGLKPLTGFKCTLLERCRNWRVEFPALSVARSSGASDHAQQVQSIMDGCERDGLRLSYVHGWTGLPEFRRAPGMKELQHDLILGSMIWMWDRLKVDQSLICGSMRLKTYRIEEEAGYVALSRNGVELANFRQKSLNDEEVRMLHCLEPGDRGRAAAARLEHLWRERIEFVADEGQSQAA